MKKDPPFLMRITTPMEQYRWDTFWDKEPETIAWIDSFEPGTCFWDVGANVGVYSLYCGSLDRNIRILAFEPHEANNEKLHLNRDESRFMMRPDGFAKIEVLCFALGGRVGICEMMVPDPTSGSTGSQIQKLSHTEAQNTRHTDGGQAQREKNQIVTVETIDHLVHVFPQYPAPDYLKIDIDGQEYSVLLGGFNTLSTVRSVLIEVSKASKELVLETMRIKGYSLDDRFNEMTPHSRERRAAEGIDAENIIFTRR